MDRWLVKGDAAAQASAKRQLSALADENARLHSSSASSKKPKVPGLLSLKAHKSTGIGGKRLPLVALDDGHDAAKSIASNVLSRLYSKPKAAVGKEEAEQLPAEVVIEAPSSPCTGGTGDQQAVSISVSSAVDELQLGAHQEDTTGQETTTEDAEVESVAGALTARMPRGQPKIAARLIEPGKLHLPTFMQTDDKKAAFTCKRFRPSRVCFDCPQHAATRSDVTHIVFDPLGVLFAVATGDGVIRVYDFDDFLRLERSDHLAQANLVCEAVVTRTSHHAISHIEWLSEDEICCAFRHKQAVHVYNLQSWATTPDVVLNDGANAQGGNASLSVLAPNKIAAAGTDGKVRMWNINAPDRPVWRMDVADCLVGIQLLGDAVLACIDRAGVVSYLDSAKMTSQAFGVKAVPTKVCSMDISAGIDFPVGHVRGVTRHGASQALVTFDGAICLVDLVRREVLSVFGCARAAPVLVDSTLPLELQRRSTPVAQMDAPTPAILLNLPRTKSYVCCHGGIGQLDDLENVHTVQFVDMTAPHRPLTRAGHLMRFVGTSNFDLTLPGFVLRAEFGIDTIQVMHDLRVYLAPRRAATLLMHKTCLLLIEGEEYEVAAIAADQITLSKPYVGPAVRDGFPKVRMRAALRPSAQAEASSGELTRLHSIHVGAKVTAFACHSELPYVVMGSYSHKLTVLTTASDPKENS